MKMDRSCGPGQRRPVFLVQLVQFVRCRADNQLREPLGIDLRGFQGTGHTQSAAQDRNGFGDRKHLADLV